MVAYPLEWHSFGFACIFMVEFRYYAICQPHQVYLQHLWQAWKCCPLQVAAIESLCYIQLIAGSACSTFVVGYGQSAKPGITCLQSLSLLFTVSGLKCHYES